ncbi:glycosyl hydrolase family 95 catalytic domain-containing protein [Sphingomonas sp. Leaf25]|uniref:glycoside hydrolase family 95 protein n=1 Tax=Sphingomonas sp. Leaf25 TaxID=1735692 RepID=UPI0006FD30C4|nr:glycoside hydrolase family 95 protein [Sphingomonas sp. Leaf25]KQM97984.1 alpha/beta hydrolase [Sphingomonas sp. Leaf25]
MTDDHTGGLTRRAMLEASLAASAALALPDVVSASVPPLRPDRLWYTAPAVKWTEALPVGNGRLGAMVFGGTARERLQLNEDTFYAGGPHNPLNPKAKASLPEVRRLIAAGRYAEAQALAQSDLMGVPIKQMPYQTIGDLLLTIPGLGAVRDYQRALDLDTARCTTRFIAGDVAYWRDVVASPDDQVIAVRVSAARKGALDLDIALTTPQSAEITAQNNGLRMIGKGRAAEGIPGALRFATLVRVLPSGGAMQSVGDAVQVRGADSVTILIAMATSYRRFDDITADPVAIVERQIAKAAARPFDRIAADAATSHQRLYRRVSIDLGDNAGADVPTDRRIVAGVTADDPGLAALYFNYARYLLITSSRAGTQPGNLQGIWNDSVDPPWGCKFTININTQMNYWPAQPLALGECVQPLVAMLKDLAITGATTAREMYGARGWVVHHNTDLWRSTAPVDGAKWGMWPTGGAWLCTHLWEHYDYHRDTAFLRDVYPVMAGACRFFLDTLVTDPATGSLMTSPSLSPENEHRPGIAICEGPAMDQQILRDLFAQTMQAAGILKIDAGFVRELTAARARLAPDRIGAQGQLQEWQADWDATAPEQNHRHVSHLYALFPSDQISLDRTPALAAAARKSLEVRGDEATGWATAWRINLWARLRDGEHAHRILRFLLGPERTYPNMFDAHPPFQIDGNFGGARAIGEMLMQSEGDTIRLLPALPGAWSGGRIAGLRARGGCGVDLRWQGGRLVEATLRPDRAGTRTLILGNVRRPVTLVAGRPLRLVGPDLRPA